MCACSTSVLLYFFSHIKDLSFGSGLGTFSGREESEPEFTRVFGSVLDPKADRDRWHCHGCKEVFVKVKLHISCNLSFSGGNFSDN
jgi:hypothetical protein